MVSFRSLVVVIFPCQLEIDCKSQPQRSGFFLYCAHLPHVSLVFHLEQTSGAEQKTRLLFIKSCTIFELKVLPAVPIQKQICFHYLPKVRAWVTSWQRDLLLAYTEFLTARNQQEYAVQQHIHHAACHSAIFQAADIFKCVRDPPSNLSACPFRCFDSGYQIHNEATKNGLVIGLQSFWLACSQHY